MYNRNNNRLILLLVIVFLIIILIGEVTAEDCIYHTGSTFNDETVPVPTYCIRDGSAKIEVMCNTQVRVTAYEDGWYYINAEDYTSDEYLTTEWYMGVDEQRDIDLPSNLDVAFLWVGSNLVGVVDMPADDCGTNTPPDARLNWGTGDHLAVLYAFGDYAQVYLPDGQLVLQFDANSDYPVVFQHWLAVYYLEDSNEYQVNILEPSTGKVFEIIASDLTFTSITIRIWE